MSKFPCPPHAFCIGQLDAHDQPQRFLQIIHLPMSTVPDRINAYAATSLKVVDCLRFASLFLGVLSFGSVKGLSQEATWVTAHEQVHDDQKPTKYRIEEENILEALDEQVVNSWVNRVIWLKVHGKQPRSLTDLATAILSRTMATKSDRRQDLDVLRRLFKSAYDRNAEVCELSGDPLATQMMHLVPFELGSGLFYEGEILGEDLMNHVPTKPIIGQAALINSTVGLCPTDATNAINSAKNLFVASAALHYIGDKKHGLLLSTVPPVWLDRQNTVHSVTSFQRGVVHPDLPVAAASPVTTPAEIERFFVQGFADAATMYMHFASPELRGNAETLFDNLKQNIREAKKHVVEEEAAEVQKNKDEEVKRKRKRNVSDVGRHLPTRPEEDDDGEGKGGRELGGRERGEWEDYPVRQQGGRPGGGQDLAGPVEEGPRISESSSGGVSESSSGGSLSDGSVLSLTRSDPYNLTDIEDSDLDTDHQEKKILLTTSTGQHAWDLLTKIDDLIFEEKAWDNISPRMLAPESKVILQRLFNVMEPGEEEIRRLGTLHEIFVAYLAMATHLCSYA
ncbi:hypothetical protein C8R47DRAFT_296644 [Mycena vitilis]|nr:hypothetical protein C8R47DRAFT_296644 [Mycena vitilis]